MFHANNYELGIKIDNIASCDFKKLRKIDNEEIVRQGREGNADTRLLDFITKKMKIKQRFWTDDDTDAMDLARNALEKLIDLDPSLVNEAEFLILAGISNPMPTVCQSSFLASEFNFTSASCWDIKSGCSTGVLAMVQGLEWLNRGAKRGIIVCSETFSKFTNKETLQMSVSIGDGACAFSVSQALDYKVLGVVHGTDSRYMKTMYVPGKYPINSACYNPMDYTFKFSEKGDATEMIAHYWQKSLEDLLKVSSISGSDIDHYIAHQVDGTKNFQVARAFNIPETSIAMNFENYGNMGCPTIFINYEHWMKSRTINPGEIVAYHAVGGGLSWAGLTMKRV